MPNKIVTVIKREYMTRVKSKGISCFLVSYARVDVWVGIPVQFSRHHGGQNPRDEKTSPLLMKRVKFLRRCKRLSPDTSTFQHKGELVYQLHEVSATMEEARAALRERVNTKDLYAYLEIPEACLCKRGGPFLRPEPRRILRYKAYSAVSFQTSSAT